MPENQDVIKTHFAKVVDKYAEWAVFQAGNVCKDIRWFMPSPGETLLDVCCGPGTLSFAASPLVLESIGIDLVSEMIEKANELKEEQQVKNAKFVVGNAEKMPFKDGQFDLVVCANAFHHLSHPEKVLEEMMRVCRRGGKVGVIDIFAPPDEDQRKQFDEIEMARDESHGHSLDEHEYHELFLHAGLKDIRDWKADYRVNLTTWAGIAGLQMNSDVYRRLKSLLLESGVAAGFDPQDESNGDVSILRRNLYISGLKA
ncbi:MAG: methyltransferase domain-containing protein [Planctomycetes bacterium]|nr:methyltransferase domain-containing protein [Planctomycetota bacterium]